MQRLSELCGACGRCCDGTLFDHVRLEPDEVAALAAQGVQTTRRPDGRPALAQRCSQLDGRRCRSYDQRPRSCRAYVCLLGQALQAGEVGLVEALAVVAGTPEPGDGQRQAYLRTHFLGRHRPP